MKLALDPYVFRETHCVFAWEDRARESSTYMRDTIKGYLDTWAVLPALTSPEASPTASAVFREPD